MPTVNGGREELEAFGAAVDRALDGRPRAWLGAEVARYIDPEGSPITQSAVSQWITGQTEPSMDKVFAIEAVLKLKPGTLSRLLGYLPASARPVATVPEAIAADTTLSDTSKRTLLAAYRAAVEE